ncbi:iron ABC transporter permease [Pseudoclavibacter endophyticus]|uniref:Iron ABC transporter permease n=1 Tax=Pseudoclavibacter endophyticus TaxID=1778590 RepID=A0A6H9WI48_9MICO|nr:ABC transporter permease subunit [Pseudoclavibacter endophyticus]KAB1648983.1 iron ABC transporter permease [Pseudoclavibacter endophyticus]GGA66521.1 iron ABC transporter permease [Pseudoclavibacter endophyticus]
MTAFTRAARRQWSLQPERNIQIAIAIAILLLFAAPVIAVLIGAFRTSPFSDGTWSTEPFVDVMNSPRTWSTLWNTVIVTVVSVGAGIALAIFFATMVTRTNARLKWLVTGTMAVMVAVPPLFYALAWSMLGNESVGLINVWLRGITTGFEDGYQWGTGPFDVESWAGLLLVSTLRNTAFMYLILVGPFSTLDRALEEASRVSGASAVRTFFGTQLPLLAPTIAAVLIVSTVVSLEAFDVPVVLGVPADIYVLPTEVFRYLNDAARPAYGHASAVSIILLGILLVLVWLERRVRGRRSFTTVSGKGARHSVWSLGPWRLPVAVATVLYAVVALGLPLLQLVLVAMSPYFGATTGFTVDTLVRLATDRGTVRTFLVTALLAGCAAAVAIVAAAIILWAARLRRGALTAFLDVSPLLPMIVPGLLLALGIITIVLLSPVSGLYGSGLLLMIALFIAAVPLASRSISGAVAQIPSELEDAARVSGASRPRTLFAVVFRLLLPSALNGWLLCFVVMSGSLAIPMLLGQRNQPMLAISVYDDYQAGNFTVAAAKFVIFTVEILVIAAVIDVIKRMLRSGGDKRGPSRPVPPAGTSGRGPAATQTETLATLRARQDPPVPATVRAAESTPDRNVATNT